MKISDDMKRRFQGGVRTKFTLDEYLNNCRDEPRFYATPAERMLKAIGSPEVIDTSLDPRLSRIFLNRTVKVYPEFSDFYGLEDVIERIVSFFTAASQELEERKQILYLLGPVGGGKSSLAERLKAMMEKEPFYALMWKNEVSPVFESPFGLINALGSTKEVSSDYRIPEYLINRSVLSPWGIKRLTQSNGDLTDFGVVQLYPSRLTQTAIMKTEPGDDNNSDISNLVGKTDIRKLENYSQDDPDAYSFSGALNRGNSGMVEFIEIWKSPLKLLHPLLTATQEGNYVGTENIGAMPFDGIVIAHSNEAEWQTFKNNRNNEAFLDRIRVITVPYCLRVDEEVKIYEKLLRNSKLVAAPCAPKTLEMLSQFTILTRLKEHENSSLFSKMRVYNGENLKDVDPHAKSMVEYREQAGVMEGMTGLSTRFAFKVLSDVFNIDPSLVEADPIHLMLVLERSIKREQFPEDEEKRYLNFIKSDLSHRYAEFLQNELQKAFLESYWDFGQNLFERYIEYADSWIEDREWKDLNTGMMYDREALNKELEKMEKPGGIANPRDFRGEIVNFCLRAKAKNSGKMPEWTSYQKIKEVIEKRMFSQTEELLPVISFGAKQDSDTEKKHHDFIERMKSRGYSETAIRRLVEWYLRVSKSS